MSDQDYCQLFCAHCTEMIRVSHVTMNRPAEYVHDPGGYELCIVNGTRPGTHAEPEEMPVVRPGSTVEISRRPGDPGTGPMEGVVTRVWDNGEYVTVLVSGKGVYVRHIGDVDPRGTGQ